jgi:parallel beta-helix repeat protein
MKGDFSKWDNDPNDNFNGVLHQQGRVLLDSDWNTQTQILNHWQTIAGQDIIGAGLAAVPADRPDSFKVIHAEVARNPDRVELEVQPGRIWADGFLVNLAGTDPRQAQYLQPPIQNPPGTVGSIAAGVRDAVILEVWQEAVNGFQTPETLIEPALGGPDTTERLQTAMAWRLYRLTDDEDCNNIRDKLQGDRTQHGKLTVSLQDPNVTTGDCPVVSSGGYTGFEHYLYRVEIADTNGTTPKFKWSQLNGGLVGRGIFEAASGGQPGKAIVTHNLQAIIHTDIKDFYLEVVEYNPTSGHQQVIYGATASLNNANELELATTPTFGIQPVSGGTDPTYFFRLWNGIADISNFIDTPAKPLQYGILLKFEVPAPGKVYLPGDYWTFKVRAGEIPNVSPLIDNQPPEGIVYHRVAVAELNWNAEKDISFDGQEIEDCRQPFRPLTNQKGCCTFSVGDGKRSQGDFNSIELAILHLPPAGGKICLLPGFHQANAVISNRQNIQISGCGIHTIVTPHADLDRGGNPPIFRIDASRNIQLDQMTLLHLTGTAIQVLDSSKNKGSSEITIRQNRIIAGVHGIEVRVNNERAGNNDILITENLVSMLDLVEGKAAIFSIADRVKIAHNRLVVIPAPVTDRPDPRPNDTPVSVFDPCKDRKPYYTNRRLAIKFLQHSFLYATSLSIAQKLGYLAQGGIQIGGGSERVKIIDNEILGGSGHGVTLGDIPEDAIDSLIIKKSYGLITTLSRRQQKILTGSFISYLYEVVIAENTIRDMGLSGVGVAAFFDINTIKLIVSVEDLTIYRNQITHCAHQLPPEIPKNMLSMCGFGGIALASCENTVIQENRIENNGLDRLQPICGIFILSSEQVDISNNRILNNGPRNTNDDINLQRGWRGGIVIGMSFKPLKPQTVSNTNTQWLSSDGSPAAKIHDNTVTQPVGQSLFLIAYGPVSIVGNSLTSQGTDFKVNPLALLAGSVFILNLGFSRDLVGYLFLNSFKQTPKSTVEIVQSPNVRLLYLPSGTVLFANNQVSLDLRSPEISVAFSSQLIASLDDVAYNNNQTECNSLIDVILTDVALFGLTIRSNDNRFQEGITIALYSLFSYGYMNIAASNQSTHCLIVLGNPALTVLGADNRVLFNPNNSCNDSLKSWQTILKILPN